MKDNIIMIFSQLCLSKRKPLAFALWTLISSISPSPDSSWWWMVSPVVLNLAQLKVTGQKFLCVSFHSLAWNCFLVCIFLLTINTTLLFAFFIQYSHWRTSFWVKFPLRQKEQWASTSPEVLSHRSCSWSPFGVNFCNPLTWLPWWPRDSLLAFTWTVLSLYLTYSWQFLANADLKPEETFTSFNLIVQSALCQRFWCELCRIFELHGT